MPTLTGGEWEEEPEKGTEKEKLEQLQENQDREAQGKRSSTR